MKHQNVHFSFFFCPYMFLFIFCWGLTYSVKDWPFIFFKNWLVNLYTKCYLLTQFSGVSSDIYFSSIKFHSQIVQNYYITWKVTEVLTSGILWSQIRGIGLLAPVMNAVYGSVTVYLCSLWAACPRNDS